MMSKNAVSRQIEVRPDACIGCAACSRACPHGRITRSREEAQLAVSFVPQCDETGCRRCANACSENAIHIIPEAAASSGEMTRLLFGLAPCVKCGNPFISQGILKKLTATLTAHYNAGTLPWLQVCPDCRRALPTRMMNLAGEGA